VKGSTLLIIVAAGLWLVPSAKAQTEFAPRTAVSFVAGVGSATSTTGVVIGGSGLVDVSDRVALEAQGTYLDRGTAASGLSASGSVLVHVVSTRARIAAYVAAGGGVYRASFDLDSPRFLGPMMTQFAPGTVVCAAPGTGMGAGLGAGFGPGTGTCTGTGGYWGVGQMNAFYARRLGAMTVPSEVWGTRSWVDPAVSLGGGARFHVTERVMIRPDARALVVLANGRAHTLGVFGVNVGYRF
jgi:hypothetical protein